MKQPCLDCPFRRDSTPDPKYDMDFLLRVFWGDYPDEQFRDPQSHICEEQGEQCLGQLKLLSNNNQDIMVDPFGEWFDLIQETEVDREEYFWHPSEMITYHQTNGDMYGQDWAWDRWGRGNKRRKPVAVVAGTQLTFEDWKNGS